MKLIHFFVGLIPNYPTTCKFLKGRMLDIEMARLPPNAPTQATLHFDKKELIEAVKNVQVWIFCTASVSLITVLCGSQSDMLGCIHSLIRVPAADAKAYFVPKIIAGMGFTSYNAQLLNVGLSVTGATYMVCLSLISEKIKERGW